MSTKTILSYLRIKCLLTSVYLLYWSVHQPIAPVYLFISFVYLTHLSACMTSSYPLFLSALALFASTSLRANSFSSCLFLSCLWDGSCEGVERFWDTTWVKPWVSAIFKNRVSTRGANCFFTHLSSVLLAQRCVQMVDAICTIQDVPLPRLDKCIHLSWSRGSRLCSSSQCCTTGLEPIFWRISNWSQLSPFLFFFEFLRTVGNVQPTER